MSTCSRFPGTQSREAATDSKMCRQASAVRGLFSEGFHSRLSPQTRASAAFQDHTATGKLKADITPTGPRGCQLSWIRCPGRSEGIVKP